MAAQILVALKSEDRLSQMIPYIEKVAQPGMKIVFLIGFRPKAASKLPYNSLAFKGLEDVRFGGTGETDVRGRKYQRDAVDGGAKALGRTQGVSRPRGLAQKGIEITVDVYAGSLKRVVKNYTGKGECSLHREAGGKGSCDDTVCPQGVSYFRLAQMGDFFSRTPAPFYPRSLGVTSNDKKEEMIMAGQILVPFNSNLRVEDIISVIEEAAKPGMRVVFPFVIP